MEPPVAPGAGGRGGGGGGGGRGGGGGLAPSGEYTVTMTAGGQTFKQTFRVERANGASGEADAFGGNEGDRHDDGWLFGHESDANTGANGSTTTGAGSNGSAGGTGTGSGSGGSSRIPKVRQPRH